MTAQADVPGLQGMIRMDIPETDDVDFWVTKASYDQKGTVHVHDRWVDGADHGRINMPFDPLGRARCGLLRRSQETVNLVTFADERLCRACMKATPAEDQSRLFEHEIERPTYEDEE